MTNFPKSNQGNFIAYFVFTFQDQYKTIFNSGNAGIRKFNLIGIRKLIIFGSVSITGVIMAAIKELIL